METTKAFLFSHSLPLTSLFSNVYILQDSLVFITICDEGTVSSRGGLSAKLVVSGCNCSKLANVVALLGSSNSKFNPRLCYYRFKEKRHTHSIAINVPILKLYFYHLHFKRNTHSLRLLMTIFNYDNGTFIYVCGGPLTYRHNLIYFLILYHRDDCFSAPSTACLSEI